MSETHQQGVNRAFRLLIGAIGGIIVVGIILLIIVVLNYRTPPGRNLPPPAHTPSSATATPSPH